MCGIHGLINKAAFAKKELGAFIEQACIVNSLRGMDATGIFQVDKNGASFSYKNNVSGSTFAELKHAKRFFSDAEGSPLTVCHVRHATMGKNVLDNAHPFVAERTDDSYIIGVHNGTITNWRSFRDNTYYDVDSEWALNQIATDGVDALEKFMGSYCFVWWDSLHPNKLFMVRNEERPMHLLYTKNKDALMFGSEAGMLPWLAERNKIETHDTIFSLEPHMLYTFDFSKAATIEWIKTNAPKYKAPASSSNSRRSSNGYWDSTQQRWVDTPPQSSTASGARGGSASERHTFPNRGQEVVDEINNVLRQNKVERYKRDAAKSGGVAPGESTALVVSDPRGRTQEKLSRKQRREASKQSVENDISTDTINSNGDGVAPAHWYSTATATHAEQQAAKSLGIMGELQWLTGVLYEPETSELLGDIEEWLPDAKAKIKHVGIIRGMSAQAADQYWINNKDSGGWGCIIGVTSGDKGAGRYFIMSPLTEKGREQMMQQAA